MYSDDVLEPLSEGKLDDKICAVIEKVAAEVVSTLII